MPPPKAGFLREDAKLLVFAGGADFSSFFAAGLDAAAGFAGIEDLDRGRFLSKEEEDLVAESDSSGLESSSPEASAVSASRLPFFLGGYGCSSSSIFSSAGASSSSAGSGSFFF